MNSKINKAISDAIIWAKDNNVFLIHGGARFIFNAEGNATHADIIGAILLMNNKVPAGIGLDYRNLVTPGWDKMAAEILEVDSWWLYRFYMGYDRGHQILFISEGDKKSKKAKEIKDEVSKFGISTVKEIFKKK